ncbi:MAG: T9SS type A sorting domain-containing protein [Chlorobi bacterium]|nr:T9SS type A sorting domain-containing protein [Chlorobiota bacterium]
MKKINTLSIIALSTLAIAVFIAGSHQLNPDLRTAHDRSLAREYQKAIDLIVMDESDNKPDHPEFAALQNYFMTFDPAENRVPVERLAVANKYTIQLQQQNNLKSTNLIEWEQTGSNMGGRTRGIMWDPNDANGYKVWACSVTGGLWYNNDISDNNSSWEIVDDFWPGLSTACIAYDPNNTQVFYVGTGEYQTARVIYRESSGVGYGIWKTIDGGQSWEILESTGDFKYISDVKVRNEDGNSVVYAGVVSGVYHGVEHVSGPSDGLYRSTDGGQNWEQVMPGIGEENLPYAPADLEIGPNGRIFVGTMKNLDGDGGATILWSDEGTAGSWTVYDYYETIIPNDPEFPVPGRVVLAAAPSDENIVYAIVGAGWTNSSNFNYARGRYILKSTDGGESWTEKNLPGGDPGWASLSWHAFALAVNPTDPNNLFAGGLDLWKTANGGSSWGHVSEWSAWGTGSDDYVHADQHWIRFKPGSSTEAIFSTDGGVFYTSNAEANYPVFVEKSRGLSTLQFYTCDIYPVAGQDIFVGGLQDNGSLLYQGSPLDVYDMVSGADGAYCFFDENEPEYMITSIYNNWYYLHHNFNSNGSFGDYGTGVFINPCDYDSENNILFANAGQFNGSNVNKILRISGLPNNPVNAYKNLGTGLNTYFSHIKVSPYAEAGTSTLFVGSQNGKLYKVTNAQATPQTEEIGGSEFPVAYISCVAIGGSEDTLLVTFTNYGVPSVWETYDGGENWNNISGNLPDMPIRWALYHPGGANQVMLATEVGIWTNNKTNLGIWTPDPGFSNVRVDMLQMRNADNKVLAATHGHGLISCTWDYDPLTTVKDRFVDESLNIFPNPSNGIFNLKTGKNISGEIQFDVVDVNGKTIFSGKLNANNQNASKTIDLTGKPKGVYFVNVRAGGKAYSRKLITQ